MSRSAFACRRCYRLLGEVKNGVLRHDPDVSVRNYLAQGYAVLTCPVCTQTRTFRGGTVEAKRAKAG